MNPASRSAELHWDITNDVACSRHAPTPGSALYRREEWRPMSAFDANLPTTYRGKALACPHCFLGSDEIDELAP